MSITAYVPLDHCRALPSAEIGVLAHTLATLQSNSLPVVPTLVIPKSSLVAIAESNNSALFWSTLQQELVLSDLHHQQVALKRIKSFILSLKIPDAYTHAWHLAYHHYFTHFVSVQPSFINPSNHSTARPQANIRGEANLIESILAVWADHVSLSDMVPSSDLAPVAVVLQPQEQPLASGKIWTSHPTLQTKTSFVLQAAWGAYEENALHDSYAVDIRTKQAVWRDIPNKNHYLQRQPDALVKKSLPETAQTNPVLNHTQIAELADLTAQVKRLFLHHVSFEWELITGRFVITNCLPLTPEESSQGALKQDVPLVRGVAINGGTVEGEAFLVPPTRFIPHIPTGKILVVKKLTNYHLPMLRHASGIVCEEYIEHPPVLSEIRRLHLPVLIEAHLSTSKIKNGQTVLLDTTSGAVYKTELPARIIKPTSVTKVFGLIGTPDIEARKKHVDAIIFSPHFLWLSTGYHPNFVVQSGSLKKRFVSELTQQLETIAHQQKHIWYRLSSFSSSDLSSLPQSPATEPESNPYLGVRGVLAALQDSSLWQTEVQAVAVALQRTSAIGTICIPFVRNSSELGLVLHLLQNWLPASLQGKVRFVVELETPASVYMISDLMRYNVHGFLVSVPRLHAHLTGFDPDNQELRKHYPLNPELILNLLTQITKAKKIHPVHSPELYLELNAPITELLRFAVQNTVPGIVTRTNIASVLKQRIIELEQELIHG